MFKILIHTDDEIVIEKGDDSVVVLREKELWAISKQQWEEKNAV